jgi:uncharacterized membrane protein
MAQPPAASPPNALWTFLAGGNTLARVGVVLLFIGVAFMIKYATEHVRVPIALRLSGVALGAIVMLVVGWRLRVKRPGYAMVVQGGAIGVLYLTVFGALQLYHLLPPLFAFVLLTWIALAAAVLAVRQDALPLAVVGVTGGFLAPLLASTGDGNEALLFGYYLVLNVGILAVAWSKAWRSLNLLGFVFTFLVGAFWGARYYQPAHFATTEPFLVAFFLFYVVLAVLYALRQSLALRHYVDGTLVFGTPLVVAVLQSALVHRMPFGMACSAVAMSAVYLALARLLYGRKGESVRMLVEAFGALGVLFATLAIPLAFDARTTTALWAVEGAGILWVGIRQQRFAMRMFALVLQLAAGWVFAAGFALWPTQEADVVTPLLNSPFVGALLIAASGALTAWWYQQRGTELREAPHGITWMAMGWAWLWWLYGAGHEIVRFAAPDVVAAALITLVAGTALLALLVARRCQWPAACVPVRLLLPMLLAYAVWAASIYSPEPLLSQLRWIAWPLAAVVCGVALRGFDAQGHVLGVGALEQDWQHASLLWLLALLVTDSAVWLVQRAEDIGAAWRVAALLAIPALMLIGVMRLGRGGTWPVGAHKRGYVVIGGSVVAAFLAATGAVVNLTNAGDPAPLPFLPLANPLDIVLALTLVAMGAWLIGAQRLAPALHRLWLRLAWGLGALAFLWLNGVLLRTLHAWAGIAYQPEALWNSTLVQATLSLLWSLVALGLMVYANRHAQRVLWMVGGSLLAIVVAKLFLVELSSVGGLPRIVSFLGVGVLVMVIGYLAPVPPRAASHA